MCGLIFCKSLDGKPVNKTVVEQFQDQIDRGTEGFGIARLKIDPKTKAEIIIVDRATKENKFLYDLDEDLHPSSMIMAHHRTPTSTPNATHQTHPFLVSHKLLKFDYLISHNGVIYNSKERQKFHMEFFKEQVELYLIDTVLSWTDQKDRINELLRFKILPEEYFDQEDQLIMDKIEEEKLWDLPNIGYYYKTMLVDGTFNDSEALAVDLALYGEKLINKIESYGHAAFIGYKLEKETHKPLSLFFGRNIGNPLNYSRNQFGIQISSEGIGNLIEADKITQINLTDPKFKQHTYNLVIPTYIDRTPTPRTPMIGFNFAEDDTEKNAYLTEQADKHFQSTDTSKQTTIVEGNGAEDDACELDADFIELLGKAELDIEDRLSDFIDDLSTTEDLESARTKVEIMAEAMNDWLDKVQKYKDSININIIVPEALPIPKTK